MLRKCTVLLAVLVAVQSASFQGRRSIPVEVRYERLEHNFLSNLSEKVQLSPEELQENQLRLEKLKAAQQEELAKKDHTNSIKNLNEKVQLSPEELLQASKHIPIHNSLRTNQDISDLERLGEQQLRNEPVSKIEQLQNIIETGLENLKNNFQPKNYDTAPSKEEWKKLETQVKDYFTEEKNKLAKQESSSQPQIIQSVTNWFQNITSNFIGPRPNGTSADEGTSQGPVQSFFNYFSDGTQNIIAAVQGQRPQNGNTTVLGDNQNPSSSNFFGNIVSGAQQIFQSGTQQFAQVLGQNSTQGDEDTGSQGGNPIQNVVQSIGSSVIQFVQGGQKPQGSEDENTSQGPGNQFLQQVQAVGQNFGTVFQNLLQNPFSPSGNQPASGAAIPETPPKQSEDSGENEATTVATATEAEKSEEMTATE